MTKCTITNNNNSILWNVTSSWDDDALVDAEFDNDIWVDFIDARTDNDTYDQVGAVHTALAYLTADIALNIDLDDDEFSTIMSFVDDAKDEIDEIFGVVR
tara:strand:+ start:119 stop:418 length:300 start_codon:yes stop_codon:yes gene_type:complete